MAGLDPNAWLMMAQSRQVPPDRAQLQTPINQPQTPVGGQNFTPVPPQYNTPIPPASPQPADTGPLAQMLKKTPQVQPREPRPDRSVVNAELDPLDAARKQASTEQEASLSDLQNYINHVKGEKSGVDWTPLAAYVDSVMPGSKLTPAAMATRGMTPDDREKLVLGLQQDLAKQRGSFANSNMQSLQAQQNYQRQLDHDAEQERFHRDEINVQSQKAEGMNGRVQVAMGNQAINAVKGIHNNSTLVQMRQQATNIDKGMDLLGANPSNKMMSEIAQDFAAALSGKAAASDMKLKELMTPTLQGQLADMKSYANSNPDQPAPPEVVKFWKNMGDRLKNAYTSQMSARAHGLLVGMQTATKHNPDAYAAAKEAADLYNNGGWRSIGEDEAPASDAHQHDSQAMAWAKANPQDPRSAAIIKANGGM